MGTYRKKPVEIEAYEFVMRSDNWPPAWLLAACERGTVKVESAPRRALHIHTLEGIMTAHEGDWIIQGVKGELYPCRADIFAETYEPVQ